MGFFLAIFAGLSMAQIMWSRLGRCNLCFSSERAPPLSSWLFGHKVGDAWEIREKTPEGLCPYAFLAFSPAWSALRTGGRFSWEVDADAHTSPAPDPGAGRGNDRGAGGNGEQRLIHRFLDDPTKKNQSRDTASEKFLLFRDIGNSFLELIVKIDLFRKDLFRQASVVATL